MQGTSDMTLYVGVSDGSGDVWEFASPTFPPAATEAGPGFDFLMKFWL
jgi:hypothetical protein